MSKNGSNLPSNHPYKTRPPKKSDIGGMPIWCWGNSLVQGVGASESFGVKLGRALSRTVNVFGAGGQTSTQIVARQGGQPVNVSITGATIPASGAVAVTAYNIAPVTLNSNPQTLLGTLAGVVGLLTRTDGGAASNTYTFTRSTAGSTVSCPDGTAFIPITGNAVNEINIFETNNGPDNGFFILTDLQAAVAHLNTAKFLVLSCPNPGGTQYINAGQYFTNESQLKPTWPSNYVDTRGYLVQHYNPAIPQDVIDYGNGGTTSCPPSSLRTDAAHPNDAGYQLYADLIAATINAKGW